MKAQVSIEFLFNFLALLVLVSVLLAALSHLISAAKISEWKMREKADIEQFARVLDGGAAIAHEKFYAEGNYSVGDVDYEGAITAEKNGEKVLGYTIYGAGGGNAEAV